MKGVSRRKFVKTAVWSGIATSVSPHVILDKGNIKTQTYYIAAYDTEQAKCLEGVVKLLKFTNGSKCQQLFLLSAKC